MFTRTRHEAREFRTRAAEFLHQELNLRINPKNDVIIRADQGLHFLGYAITNRYAIVDTHTTKQALNKVNTRNLASYKSLNIVKWPKRQLDWRVLDEIDEILG